MADDKGRHRDPTSVLKELEEEIERLKSGRKEQIEKKLQEKILRERKEAADEISRVEKEYEHGREELKKYQTFISDYETARDELQARIREHLARVEQCKAEISKFALAAATSLREVDRQNKKFLELRRVVEEKAAYLKEEIAQKLNITVQLPERQNSDELMLDVEGEIIWFQRIMDDLEGRPRAKPESKRVPKPEPRPEPRPEPKPVPKPEQRSELRPAFKPASAVGSEDQFPELQDLLSSAEFKKTEPARAEPKKPAVTPPPALGQAAKSKDEAILEAIKQFVRYDPTDHAGEMRYFQKEDKIILDGEFIVGAIRDSLDATRVLYEKIGQTKASKDQFFIKQEIVNHQEALRKVILRGVRMCENEDCQLPAFTLDIVNLAILKNILEMLNVGNWSSEEDFLYFVRYADRVKTAYFARITPPAVYFAAILSELAS